MKKLACLLVLLIGCSISAQVTIIVEELPKETPKNASIFISGDFEGWSGGQKKYQLELKDDVYSITIPKIAERILFKFTQGSWESVECDNKGISIDNRFYLNDQPNDTLDVKIAGWNNLFDSIKGSTISKNVSVLSEDFEIPQLNRKRRIWMYLPPDYEKSSMSYPVVYMHDGQNLFDNSSSFSGEWNVDETLDKLYKEKNLKLIVVGIDNGGVKRLDEYSPWTNEKYGGGEGDAYLDFIVKTLKPYIDSNYKTLKDKNNTAIIGSSMGGLISYYAGLKYPKTFGKIGVFSPAFWFAPEINEFSEIHGDISDTQLYFLAGGKEGSNTAFDEINQTVKDMNSMVGILKNQGFTPENIRSKVVPEGKHNEELWRINFEETILWLFPNAIKKREFVQAKLNDNYQLEVDVSDGTYKIQFYSPKIIETTFIPTAETTPPEKSHAVVLTSIFSDIQYSEEKLQAVFKTKDLSAVIKKEPFNISYTYKGKPIISEKTGYHKIEDGEAIQFNLDKDEVLYGGGARALGMNRRGNRLQLYNKAHYGYETRSELMNYTMPLVMSSKQYAVHFDNAPIGYLDLDSKKDNTLTYETISGRKTYQVIVGDSWLDVIDNYTDLTGKQPLPPRWALGNFSSRFGYHTQDEVLETVDKFKEENIPVDAVIIDIYWFGKDIKGHMGNLNFLKDSFPNPKQMIKTLRNKGVKTVLVTEPFVLTTSKRWQEAVDKEVLAKDSIGNPFKYDFYFGNTGLIDVYSSKGKAWFWNIYKELAEIGVKGVWGDLGEPEVHPSKLIHATGTADEVHNIYGHDWARLVYEGYKIDFPDQRPFILMRSGSSGSQRFGLIPWSGDVNRSWGGLQPQTEIALQMAMQGLAYMHSDLGGFAGPNLDDELYARWLQYGVFQPIYRPHAQEEVPSEPVFREPKTKALAKEAIELRYKLLPYNYTLAFENNQNGTPLMRPLFFEEPDNRQLLTNASTYLWGNDFLVTPIVNPNIKEKEVYFPKNNVWFDFYSDKKIEGGQTKTVKTKDNSIPTFVRAGAFIPMAELVQTTDNYSTKNIELHYYHDSSVIQSNRQLYNDDGLTPNTYKKGGYEILKFEAKVSEKRVNLEFEAEIGTLFKLEKKRIDLKVHNIQNPPKRIKINRKKIKFSWDQNANIVSIPVQWNTAEELKITIKL